MDARAWFLAGHARELELERPLWELPEGKLRHRLGEHSSLAWLFWHMARCEDVGVNLVLRDAPQVLQQDGWAARLGVAARDIGTGMPDDEAAAVGRGVDLGALRGYREAVSRQTRAGAATADFDRLGEPIRMGGRRATERGAIRAGLSLAERWDRRTGEFFLSWLASGHLYAHLGEAQHVAQVLQVRLGSTPATG